MSGRLIDTIDKERFENEVISEWLGVPYVHRGRNRDGIDCWGLPLKIYEKAGVKLFDVPDFEYNVKWSKEGGNFLAENAYRDWTKIESPEFLDGILFKNLHGIAYHTGIVLTGGKFIHATMYGVIISKWKDKDIIDKIEGFYRLKGLYGIE